MLSKELLLSVGMLMNNLTSNKDEVDIQHKGLSYFS